MQKIEANDTAAQSLDIVSDNLSQLQALFPEAFSEGKIQFDTLRQLLGGAVDEADEKYGLNWHGKRRARQIALTPSTGTLRPCPDDSADWATTQNLMIEGDNLEVLKLLQKSYAGKVKLIYIDPPYNTGKDFVYPDDFRDSMKNYLELTGQVDGSGKKMVSNTESNGRFHTDWLSMIYPRLRLARNLLSEDGVILISLDDTEAANIRLLLNEIFGEEMFIGTFPWRSRTAKADVPFGVSNDVEWVIAYGRPLFLAGRAGERKYFESSDFESRWRLSDLTKQTTKDERPNSYFTMVNPKDGAKYPANANRTWSITEDTFPDYLAKGKIVFPGDYPFLRLSKPAFRVFETEDKEKALRKHGTEEVRMSISTYLPEKDVGRTEHGSKEIRELFDAQVFSFPKPVPLIQFFIENCTDKNSLVMDFFAGSGTTGQAVLEQNLLDGGNRRYLLVQLPEPLDSDSNEQKTAANFCTKLRKPLVISELTKERLRRAAKSVKARNPTYTGDVGFRSFKLDSSNITQWESNRDNLAESLFANQDHLRRGRTEADLVYEIVLKLGLDLCVSMETRQIAGKTVGAIGGGVLMVCLSESIKDDDIEGLAAGIVKFNQDLRPVGRTTFIFKDGAFGGDSAKLNLSSILEQHLDCNVKSI